MALYTPPTQQQGFYRYDPLSLRHVGPARLFPGVGEDGVLIYVLIELQQNLVEQGRVSEPLSLVLQQLQSNLHQLNEQWNRLGTLLADWQFFQSPWFNFGLPPGEQFSSVYVSDRQKMARALLDARKAAQEDHSILTTLLQFLTQPTQSEPKTPRQRFYQALESFGRSQPSVICLHERDGGLSDREFARQRLAGANPMIIRRVGEAEHAALQTWQTQLSYTSDSSESLNLTEAVSQKRLFVVDYPLFQSLTTTELQTGKYVGNPQALFYRSEQGLEPVFIQLERGGKFFSPNSEVDEWTRAKLYTQVADVTHHELIAHLCYTHLAMEALAIATARQLPTNHPLHQLLHPHFRFLLAINQRGNVVLLAEGAAIDSLLAPTRSVSMNLIDQAYRERPFQNYALPNDIRERGIDSESLPEFAYRDDASLLWEAIADYTSSYLQRYYSDDVAVQQDPYLQAWAAELGAPLNTRPLADFPAIPGVIPAEIAEQVGIRVQAEDLPTDARVPDFPSRENPGRIVGLQQLIDIATQVIFTCGPQHAAVNFSQFDYIGYPPNAPMSAYVKPSDATSVNELLPPWTQDQQQMELTFALSGIIWSQLGDDRYIQFSDSGDRKILQQFQARLSRIETEIQQRNQHRLQRDGVAYPYLLPSQIPNSINI